MNAENLYICSECGLINCTEGRGEKSINKNSSCSACGVTLRIKLRSQEGQGICVKHQKITPDNYYLAF